MNWILLTIGILLYVASKLNEEYTHDGFSWRDFLRQHAFVVLCNVALGAALMIAPVVGAYLEPIVAELGSFIYLFIGYMGQSVFDTIVGFFNKKKKTRFGRNEK